MKGTFDDVSHSDRNDDLYPLGSICYGQIAREGWPLVTESQAEPGMSVMKTRRKSSLSGSPVMMMPVRGLVCTVCILGFLRLPDAAELSRSRITCRKITRALPRLPSRQGSRRRQLGTELSSIAHTARENL